MNVASHVFALLCALALMAIVVDRLRRRRLRERHAVWWFLGALLALVAGLFPSLVVDAAEALGFEVPANLLFFVSVVLLVFVAIQYASELTALESQTRTLAERVALLELELRTLRGDDDQREESTGESAS